LIVKFDGELKDLSVTKIWPYKLMHTAPSRESFDKYETDLDFLK